MYLVGGEVLYKTCRIPYDAVQVPYSGREGAGRHSNFPGLLSELRVVMSSRLKTD